MHIENVLLSDEDEKGSEKLRQSLHDSHMDKIYHRNFILNSNDFQDMVCLLTELYGKGNHNWTLGRLYAWRYGLWTPEARNPEIFSRSAELFFDGDGVLLGFIVLEECGGNTAAIFARDEEPLLEEMVHFLDLGGNFRNAYSVYCSENSLLEIEVLRRHKYVSVGYEDITFEYCAEEIVLPAIDLPDGYTLADGNTFLDIERLERFRFSAFNPNTDFDEETAWAYRYARENPFIKKELCIILLDESKDLVSSCVGYFDAANSDVEIEVVCTKKEEEGKGFAKAVIVECIRRSLEMGAKRVNISGWDPLTKHLYSSFGKNKEIQKISMKKEEQ